MGQLVSILNSENTRYMTLFITFITCNLLIIVKQHLLSPSTSCYAKAILIYICIKAFLNPVRGYEIVV